MLLASSGLDGVCCRIRWRDARILVWGGRGKAWTIAVARRMRYLASKRIIFLYIIVTHIFLSFLYTYIHRIY